MKIPLSSSGASIGQAQRLAEREVLRAAAGRDVDDPGPLLLADLVPGHDPVLVAAAVGPAGRERRPDGREVVERAPVAPAHEVAARDAPRAPRTARRAPAAACPCRASRTLVALADLDVAQVGAHRRRHVGRQRPRRRRPDEERLAGPVHEREAHREAGVGPVRVALGHLVLADARPAARAPGHRVVALVEPAAAVALGEEAPRSGRCSRC